MTNERTSKKVASIAGKVLEELKSADMEGWVKCDGSKGGPTVFLCTVRELKALAASALTQAPDNGKRKKASTKGRK